MFLVFHILKSYILPEISANLILYGVTYEIKITKELFSGFLPLL
jgi:hypothetical protein